MEVVVVHRGHLRSSAASVVRAFDLYNTVAHRIHARVRRMAHRIRGGRRAGPSHEEDRWRSARTRGDRPTRRCSSTSIASSVRTSRSGRTRQTRPNASRSGPLAIVGPRSTAPSTRPTSRPRPRRSAGTARARASTARCSSARTRTPCPNRRSRRTQGPRRARRRRPRRCGRRLHADAGRLARDPRPQPRPARPPGRRHRRHPVAQPARGRRLQVQPAQRRPGRHRRHERDPGRGEPAARGGPRRRPARPDRAGTCPDRPPMTT